MRLIDVSSYEGCRIVANKDDTGIQVKKMPTVDAVPVVRCGECVNRYTQDCALCSGVEMDADGVVTVRICGAATKEDFYCAEGKKK